VRRKGKSNALFERQGSARHIEQTAVSDFPRAYWGFDDTIQMLVFLSLSQISSARHSVNLADLHNLGDSLRSCNGLDHSMSLQ